MSCKACNGLGVVACLGGHVLSVPYLHAYAERMRWRRGGEMRAHLKLKERIQSLAREMGIGVADQIRAYELCRDAELGQAPCPWCQEAEAA